MYYSFEKPVGAACDVRELEYITALVQTQHGEESSFRDGSIEASDVKNYLLSRHGIEISTEHVHKYIFHDLAGSRSEDESLDIPEIVSLLLIPYLRKITSEDCKNDQGKDSMVSRFEQVAYERKNLIRQEHASFEKNIIGDVLKIIMIEATGSDEERPLSVELLRQIFLAYDEKILSRDEKLLNDMVAAASMDDEGENEILLDSKTFAKGLTDDLDLYNPMQETKFTTCYEDVFGLVTVDHNSQTIDEIKEGNDGDFSIDEIKEENDGDFSIDEKEEGNDGDFSIDEKEEGIEVENLKIYSLHSGREENHTSGIYKRVFTFPQIDNLSDSFRDKTQYIVVWLAALFGYLAYFEIFSTFGISVCKPEKSDAFGCQVLNSITIWFTILSTIVLVMVPTVMLLSLGNNVHRHSPIEILVSCLAIALFVFFPALYHKIDNRFMSTADEHGFHHAWFSHAARVINLMLGGILCFFQICNIVRYIIPDNILAENKVLTLVLRGSGVRSEFGIKQAAIRKVHDLVKNAFELSKSIIQDSDGGAVQGTDTKTPSAISLLNYIKLTERRETCGGFFWAWKSFLSDSLVEDQGIWIHTRLLAGTLAQLVVTLFLTFGAYMVANEITLEFYPTEQVPQNNRCGSFTDPSMCFFPDDGNGNSMGIGFCNNVHLTNITCLSEFVRVPDEYSDYFCNMINEYSFMSEFNQYLDADSILQLLNDDPLVCPDLYIPYPSEILTAFEGSQDDLFCVAPIAVCTPTVTNSTIVAKGNCIIGMRDILPFQFSGELCSNQRMFNDDFNLLYTQKMEYEEVVMSYMPTKNTLKNSFNVGIAFGFFAGFSNFAISIPSQIVTTMKFRTGATESLRDKEFLRQRVGMLNMTYLLGALVWGTIMTFIAVFLSAAGISFLVMFHVTRPYIFGLLSALIGALTTMIVKALVSLFLNRYSFAGFYRKRPVLANVANVIFECWHLAVTSTFIIIRAVKLIAVVTWNIGRIDQPMLAKGVGEFGPIVLDNFPSIFEKDLLSIDSHRHPYIERLGMMYLMKLKHGKRFASRAGCHWRILFVLALMPYLRKNRIDAVEDKDDDLSEDESEYELSLMQTFGAELVI